MRRLGLAILLIACSLRGSVAAGEAGPPLDDLRWIDRNADAAVALTTAPAECLAPASDPRLARRVAMGRVAFRSPVLLGGLAARVRMRCDSCHRNGHDNPVFFMAGVSATPGTADVTGSIFSTLREDEVPNAVPIPSLVGAAHRSPFGTIKPVDELRLFLVAVIVDEFQGRAPPEAILDGLQSYLEALDPEACPEAATMTIDLGSEALEIDQIFEVLLDSLADQDDSTVDFLLASLRAALGRVHQRFPAQVGARNQLVEISGALEQQRPGISHGRKTVHGRVSELRGRTRESMRALERSVAVSYYDLRTLRASLARRTSRDLAPIPGNTDPTRPAGSTAALRPWLPPPTSYRARDEGSRPIR